MRRRTISKAEEPRRARRLVRAVAVSLAVVLLAGVVVLGAIQTTWFGRWLASMVAQRVNGQIAGELTLAGLDFDGTRVSITDVVVRDPQGSVVARIPRLTLDFALWPLFSRHLRVEELDVERPFVRFVTGEPDAGLRAALQPKTPKSRTSPSFTVDVDHARINDGIVEALIATGNRGANSASIRELDISFAGSLTSGPGRFEIDLSAEGITAGLMEGPVTLEVDAAGRRGAKAGIVEGLSLARGNARLAVGDRVNITAAVTSDDRLAVAVHELLVTPEQLRWFGARWPIAASLSVAGTLALAPNQLGFNVRSEFLGGEGAAKIEGTVDRAFTRTPDGIRLAVRDFTPNLLMAQAPALPIDVEARISPGSLKLEQLALAFSLHAPAVSSEAGPWGPLALEGHLQGGELQSLRGRMRMPGARLNLHRVKGASSARDPGIAGTLHITNLGHVGRALASLNLATPSNWAGRGRLGFSVRGDLGAGLSSVGIRARGSFPKLQTGALALREMKLNLAIPAAVSSSRLFHVDATMAAPLAMALRASGRRVPRAAGSDAGFALSFEKFSVAYRGRSEQVRWRLQTPTMIAYQSRSGLHIDSLTMVARTQRLSLSSRPTDSVTQVRASLDQVLLASLPAPLASVELPKGRISGSILAKLGDGRASAKADLKLTGGRWRGKPFTAKVAGTYRKRAQRANGQLAFASPNLAARARFDVPTPPFPSPGGVLLKAQVSGEIGPESSLALGRARVEGTFSGSVEVTGTMNDPRLETRASLRGVQVIPTTPGSPDHVGIPISLGPGDLTLTYDGDRLATIVAFETGGTSSPPPGTLRVQAGIAASIDLAALLRDPATRRRLLQQPLSGTLTARGIDANRLAALVDPIQRADGQIAADAKIEGTLAAPDLEMTLRWREGRIVIIGESPSEGRTSLVQGLSR